MPLACLRTRTAYRSEDLDQGIECTVLELAWGEEGVARQAQFVARAREEIDAGCGLTFVEVGLRRSLRCGSGEPLAPVTVVLVISMWRCGHPCGLLGRIELDAEGRPTGAAQAPLPPVHLGGWV
jgi:hypothetical protein